MITKNAHWLVRDNLVDPVVEAKVPANGDFSYRLANGLTYHLDAAGRATLDRLGYTLRLSKELKALEARADQESSCPPSA